MPRGVFSINTQAQLVEGQESKGKVRMGKLSPVGEHINDRYQTRDNQKNDR